ncbi:MAG: hypothetical protein WBK46_06725 [Ruminococcus flavefaciens]
MKMRCTALLLTALICMAGAASCGKVQTADESSAHLKIAVTTTAAGDVTTSTGTGTTTTGNDGSTDTTTGTDTTTAAAAETTAASAQGDAAPAATAAPADNGGNNETPAAQEQPQQNNETPVDNGNANTQPVAQEVKFSTDDLLKNAADIIAALGGSPVTSTASACTSNGCDVKTYDYAGELKIQCYIDGGVEYFFDYDILGGNYSTSKGIKVGSSRADVEAAYGAGEESGNMLIYNDGAKQLIFTLNGDTVSEIDFYVPV